MTIPLNELISALSPGESRGLPQVPISGIIQDSRQVERGSLFVAVEGGNFDGHDFIRDAIQRGASAIVGSREIGDLPIPYILVADSRVAVAHLAAAFYRFPARQLTVIGVTGTDGKTTTANLIYHLMISAGLRVGMISTINAVIGEREMDTGFHVTTPEATHVQAYLARMVEARLTHVILEATSHGLAQERVTACEFDIGVVTNITHEHLDFHGGYQAYRGAKGLLFSGLGETKKKSFDPPRTGVLNRDDVSYEYLSGITTVGQLSYGLHPQADIRASRIDSHPDGLSFIAVGADLNGETIHLNISTQLVGAYNVSNCLAAVATGRGVLGLEDEAVANGIAALPGIIGRMERIDMGQDFLAVVDFAHTPNALKRVLESARDLTDGRIIAVFGSAGLRDREKRRLMAETSVLRADLTVLTAEDPRTESLDAILAEMAAGARSKGALEGKTFWRVRDRGEAIRFALRLARPGDLVIACGKGHEQSMCFGETEYSWDDRIAMKAALTEYLNIPGPEMPYLPTQD